ncbi:ABC transporter permease [Anaerovoracaceae bacterium 41-7]|nr:ABC transporter permease [Emergencia sp.]
MKRLFLIAAANLRRAKGQTAAIVALVLLASVMLNLGLMLSMDYKENFDRYHEELNAEHVILAVGSRSPEVRKTIEEELTANVLTEDYSFSDAYMMIGSFPYGDGEINSNLLILEKETALSRSIGKVEIVEEDCSSGIYLPMLYGTDGRITAGGTVDFTIGNTVENYPVCGFINSVMAGSHNCVITAVLFTKDRYDALKDKGIAAETMMVSVRIKDKEQSQEFEAVLKNAVSSAYPDLYIVSNSYELVTSSRYISQMICTSIVSAMACFIALIALVVISSNVINYIQENMHNLGALKAMGYTSRQLVESLLLQFSGVALPVSCLGAAAAYGIFPMINNMMISQTGIPYKMHFLSMPYVITICLLTLIVSLVVWLSARRIENLEPITALRQGIRTHSFAKSYIPLERTRFSLTAALGLKAGLSQRKQNIVTAITVLVLSLFIVFSGLMRENMIVNMEPFINLIVGETADSCISIDHSAEDAFLQRLAEDEKVEKVYLYHSEEVRHKDGVALMMTCCDDFNDVNNQNVVFDGRFPKYDNEVALAGKYAGEKDLEIGDEITLSAGGKEAVYLICGLTQISNNLGKDCLLTRSGYERMADLQNLSFYIDVAEGVDIDEFHEEISEAFGTQVNTTINVASAVIGGSKVYVSLMKIIVIAILALSFLITVFVLYLLVRIMLNRKKKDYGIMKALGFTTWQLILQTALSFMPVVILSAAVGLIISALIINPLTALFLQGIGIVKCTFTVPIGFITVCGALLVLFVFAVTCILSLRIRRISPKDLLSGE